MKKLFEAIIRKTLETLPADFNHNWKNVEITVEDEPPNLLLLGLYQGYKTERYRLLSASR